MRAHAWIDRRSLALHEAVAAKLEAQPQLLDIARANLQRWIGSNPAAALREGLRLLKEEDRRAALAGIAIPALLIHGERDRITPVAAARFMASSLPQARLELVPGAGHAPFLSHASHFLEQLHGFIHG